MNYFKNIWTEDFLINPNLHDRKSALKIYCFVIPLLCYVIFWDYHQLHVVFTWHYVLVKAITIGTIILGLGFTYYNKKVSLVPIVLMCVLYLYSFYGIVAIDFTYCYSFWEIYFATSFFFRISKKAYTSLMLFGGVLNIIGLQLAAEPHFIKDGFSFKPHIMIVTCILYLLTGLLFYLVTKKRDEIFELQEKFALIGKQSSYVFHEIKKPINRLLSSSKDIDTDIHLISNILLNIELMLKNPESFKESFNHFKLNLLFLRLESEFTDYFTEYNIKFVYPTHDCDLHANEGLIYQVFKNLIVNAIEAIIANKISDESQSITINYLEKNNENKISLIFANTGSQISKLNHENIFNPFYSTKNNGKNNGLGLSFCKNIIEGHQGTIEFKPGKSGPEFLITI